MSQIKNGRAALALTLVLAVGPGLAAAAAEKDIVETAQAAGGFNTLLTAATQAGLVETLKGEGPFTVFAPTDEAFAKVPAATLDALLRTRPSSSRCCSTTWCRAG
jgi:uncharacterized surface protein with fasciclin (FAS1) repeats